MQNIVVGGVESTCGVYVSIYKSTSLTLLLYA